MGWQRAVEIYKTEEDLGMNVQLEDKDKFLVNSVSPSSFLFRNKYVKAGDYILGVEGVWARGLSVQQLLHLLRSVPLGESFTLHLYRPSDNETDWTFPQLSTNPQYSDEETEVEEDAEDGPEITDPLGRAVSILQDVKKQYSDDLLECSIEDLEEEVCTKKLEKVELLNKLDALQRTIDETELRCAEVQEKNTCKICGQTEVQVVLKPCCHYTVCHSCVINLSHCPTCAKRITSVVPIYAT